MKKILILILMLCPLSVSAQESVAEVASNQLEVFEARVIEILDQREITRSDGSKAIQQNVKLRGESGKWQGKEVVFYGIDEVDAINSSFYKVGDRVQVLRSVSPDNQDVFYITDFVRHRTIWWLLVVFIIAIVVVARWKGVMSIASLLLTFIIILYFIIPKILGGSSPLFITIVGCLLILPAVIYLTEGFKRSAHLAVISIVISLSLTGILAVIFTAVTKLSGLATEEIMFLVGETEKAINFKGLLLAGIIIGTLGVLDDVIISQIASVEELKKSNPHLPNSEIFKRAMRIGISHIGSMTNTLFLAYAGASLPLLLLFSLKQEPFLTFSQILDNEMIATEIVRTLVGSIGLALSVPIATGLATKFGKVKHE